MNPLSLPPAPWRSIVIASALAFELLGLALLLSSLRLRNPQNPPRVSWRVLEWKPIRQQRVHFLGRGFGLYKNGIHLFILGAAVQLLSLLIRR